MRIPDEARGSESRGAGHLSGVSFVALVLVLLTTSSAEAQRVGRRFRSAPAARPPANALPAPPRAPASAPPPAAAPGTPRNAAAKERPQTTANPTPKADTPTDAPDAPHAPGTVSAADVAWQGVVPFSDHWRRLHPSAWRAEATEAEVALAAGEGEPTSAERLASHDEPAPMAGSVLVAGFREPALLVFPDDPAASAGDHGHSSAADAESSAASPAEDGTVSVLVRNDAGPGAPADQGIRAAEPGLLVSSLGSDDPKAPVWLPLGAFAAVPARSEDLAVPHVFLEVSLHRDGRLRGNYFDALSDAVHPLEGWFDRDAGLLRFRVGRGAEFEAPADGLAAGRGRATVRSGDTERSWTLIGLR